jgi:hypothetical protein
MGKMAMKPVDDTHLHLASNRNDDYTHQNRRFSTIDMKVDYNLNHQLNCWIYGAYLCADGRTKPIYLEALLYHPRNCR